MTLMSFSVKADIPRVSCVHKYMYMFFYTWIYVYAHGLMCVNKCILDLLSLKSIYSLLKPHLEHSKCQRYTYNFAWLPWFNQGTFLSMMQFLGCIPWILKNFSGTTTPYEIMASTFENKIHTR